MSNFDITMELNGIKARLEALEQRMYVISHTQDESTKAQKAVNLKAVLKNG